MGWLIDWSCTQATLEALVHGEIKTSVHGSLQCAPEFCISSNQIFMYVNLGNTELCMN